MLVCTGEEAARRAEQVKKQRGSFRRSQKWFFTAWPLLTASPPRGESGCGWRGIPARCWLWLHVRLGLPSVRLCSVAAGVRADTANASPSSS